MSSRPPKPAVSFKVLPLYFFLFELLRTRANPKINVSNTFPIGLTSRPKTDMVLFNYSVRAVVVFVDATVKHSVQRATAVFISHI